MVRPGDVIQTSLPVHGNWSLKGVAAVCWFVVPQRMSCEGHHTPSFCGQEDREEVAGEEVCALAAGQLSAWLLGYAGVSQCLAPAARPLCSTRTVSQSVLSLSLAVSWSLCRCQSGPHRSTGATRRESGGREHFIMRETPILEPEQRKLTAHPPRPAFHCLQYRKTWESLGTRLASWGRLSSVKLIASFFVLFRARSHPHTIKHVSTLDVA